jgi:hypothetical protein
VTNWIAQQALAKDGRIPKSLEFEVQAAYLNASLASDSTVLPGGRAVSLLNWDELDADVQAQFSEIYLQSRADSWPREGAAKGDVLALRDPIGKEFYAAFWGGNEYCVGSKRFNLRVDASGANLSIDEHDSGVCIYANGDAAASAPPENH